MRRLSIIATIALLLLSLTAFGQENLISLNGGYAFANLEEADENTAGWRIGLSYEFNPSEGAWAHGGVVSYISTESDATDHSDGLTKQYKINTWPIYYAPKFLFGGDRFKGFLKGALGMQISNFKRTGPILIFEDNGFGFYGGLGAGTMVTFGTIFINAEYEWAYMSNSYYRDGVMNSAMLGVGIYF